MEILDRLQQDGILTTEIRQQIEARVTEGLSTEAALLSAGIPTDTARTALADYYGIPTFIPTDDNKIDSEVLKYIPVEAAKNYEVVPLKMEEDVLALGVNDPDNIQLREALSFISTKHGVAYKFYFVLESDLQKLLKAYDSLSGEVDQALSTLEDELDKEIAERKRGAAEEDESLSQEHIKEDAPVTKVVATILRYAVDGNASDIHIEPTYNKVKVRFRVDGLLTTSLELPANVQPAVVARIKILSSMRLDEKRKPQDGRFSATFDGRKIDFRVSVLPTNHGEKVVMRILDNERGISTLESTGISEHHLKIIRRIIKEPYGIILISGPTGSGKSTTLYAMLSEVDRATKNVLSLEDPIEYNIDGVSQSQVKPEIGYTFASGLRSALRQDPDVIMVGEIRDKETAQLAIQAALTGHLVLSTIHTNNAIGVVPRLIDMGVDPYLIAPTLKLAIAQRLARRLCPGTGKSEPVEGSIKMLIDNEFKTLPEKYRGMIPEMKTVYHPEPSPGCASGTKGRVAIMEALEIDKQIQDMILKGASEEEMYQEARSRGFTTMKEDAIIKALEGTIPYEEVSTFGTQLDEQVTDVTMKSSQPAVDNPPSITDDASIM
ncbi:type II/IV secretion system protein [Candidatus Nomurabacteria bacterium]|nr:type II/IV secretion system protein [Candidatus Nomurabacteria bacterium]